MADLRIITRPLLTWPGQLRDDAQRRPNPFTVGYDDTMDLLKREARLLGAREVVVQIAVTEAEIRIDGQPYARAKAKHPGCTVVLPESAQGRISWSTDAYRGGTRYRPGGGHISMEGWQVNLRAIALSMEALRAADRHGVMQGRQYAGFRELGAGIEAPEHVMTVEEAARTLLRAANWPQSGLQDVIDDPEERRRTYREAARQHHPDVGGDHEIFARIQEAKEVLERHG